MGIADQIRSFHRRRIDIPVGAAGLVLDVGSGDKPHWRADVLLDRYVDAEHALQRSGRASARVNRPLFDADAADMPFADGVFDYVICSHMLEHVPEPGRVIDEMVRVARAGYIEVPEAASAKIVDFPSHLWWCRLVDGTLVFTAKTDRYFDPEIDAFLDRSRMRQPIADLLDRHLDHRVIELRWAGAVSYQVDGRASDRLLSEVADGEFHHRGSEALASRLLTIALTAPLWRKRRRKPIYFDDVVRPEFRRGRPEVLDRRVYRLDT
ncbi:MAG: class I SAM-dependent methyltransferase [Ilumatobacteraceae bacterium]